MSQLNSQFRFLNSLPSTPRPDIQYQPALAPCLKPECAECSGDPPYVEISLRGDPACRRPPKYAVRCPVCQMRGPRSDTIKGARDLWDLLPRPKVRVPKGQDVCLSVLVSRALARSGFEGLYNTEDGCDCDLANVCLPCDGNCNGDCQAGYKQPHPTVPHTWVICPERKE